MPTKRDPNWPLIFLDVETTGFAPRCGHVLELAMAAVDPKTLVILDTFEALSPRINALHRLQCAPHEVQEMHQASGLADALAARPEAELTDCYRPLVRAACRWLNKHSISTQPPMCGNSVHFDRAWLGHHMPELAGWFSHRNIDVSSLRELWASWGLAPFPKPQATHRAAADLRDCVAELAHYRNFIKGS